MKSAKLAFVTASLISLLAAACGESSSGIRPSNNEAKSDPFLLQVPINITNDLLDVGYLLNFPTTPIVLDGVPVNAIVMEGQAMFVSNVIVPVDTAKTYRLSGAFRSIGSFPSRLYYGVATYDADQKHIESYEAVRRENSIASVVSFNSSQIVVDRNISLQWYSGGVPEYFRQIGFYFDGNTNRRPDVVLGGERSQNNDSAVGVYSTAEGTVIQLNAPLPPAVAAKINSKTKIANHFSGPEHVYSAAAYIEVPATSTNYMANMSGEGFIDTSDPTPSTFRPGTKYVRFVVFGNVQQSPVVKMVVERISFEEVNE